MDRQPIDYDDCHKRLTHGIPLSLEEQRQLCEQATGYPIARRKRCKVCDGSAKVKISFSRLVPRHWEIARCGACQGSGYVPEESDG